jgi:hypothetical protein
MYQAVMVEGRWRIEGPDGRLSKYSSNDRRHAEAMARKLDNARALYFTVMDEEVTRL